MSARSKRLEAEIDELHGAGYYRAQMKEARNVGIKCGAITGLTASLAFALLAALIERLA